MQIRAETPPPRRQQLVKVNEEGYCSSCSSSHQQSAGKDDWTSSPLPRQRQPIKKSPDNRFSSPKSTGKENLLPIPEPVWVTQTPAKTVPRLPMVQEQDAFDPAMDEMPTMEEVNYMPAWVAKTPTTTTEEQEGDQLSNMENDGILPSPTLRNTFLQFESPLQNNAAESWRSPKVRNTFLQFDSPLRTISVATPPKSVPPHFAPVGLAGMNSLTLCLTPQTPANPPGTTMSGVTGFIDQLPTRHSGDILRIFDYLPTPGELTLPNLPSQCQPGECQQIPGDVSMMGWQNSNWAHFLGAGPLPPMEGPCSAITQDCMGANAPHPVPDNLNQGACVTNNSCLNMDNSQVASMCTDASFVGTGSMSSMQMQSSTQVDQPQMQQGQSQPQIQMQMPQMQIQMSQTQMQMQQAQMQLPQAQIQMSQAQMQLPQSQPQMQAPQGQPQMTMQPNQMQAQQMHLQQPQVAMEQQFQMQQRFLQMQVSLQPDMMQPLQSQLMPQMLMEVPPLACLCTWLAGNSRADVNDNGLLFPVPTVNNPGGIPPIVPGSTRWADEPMENSEMSLQMGTAATASAPPQPCSGTKVSISAMHFPEPSASAMVQARATPVPQSQPQSVPSNNGRGYK